MVSEVSTQMRFLMKVSLPTDKVNEMMKAGKFGPTLDTILSDLKPEAAYFIAENGERMACLVVDMEKPSELPKVAEPFFHAFGSRVEATPAMVLSDVREAGPAIEAAASRFG